MAKLDNYAEPHEIVTIKTAGGEMPLAVYGLGLEQIIWLAREYGEQLAPVYKLAQSGELDDAAAMGIVTDLSSEAPILINMTIFYALQCDDPDELGKIAKMPLGARVAILEACGRQTFYMEGGPGKLWEIAKKTFIRAAGLMERKEIP